MARETVFTAHRRPGGADDEPDLVLVKEGVCWPALFVPLLWLLWHRLWLGLAGYLAGAVLLAGLAYLLALAVPGQLLLAALYALLTAGAANDLRRWALARSGYRLEAIVAAAGLVAAERRLFRSAWFERWRAGRRRMRQPVPLGPPEESLT